MSAGAAALLALAIIAMLFAVAAVVEASVRTGAAGFRRVRLRHGAYTLALAVYCSSWTLFGAVGTLVREGWTYLPIYAAPMLLLLAAPRFLGRLSRAVAEEQAATVADFIAARFGHDPVVARLVTLAALLGTVPYLALQFRAIATGLAVISGTEPRFWEMVTAGGLLALFAIRFGARRFELAGRSEGLVYAIALDSLLKLAALVAVSVAACLALWHMPAPQWHHGVVVLSHRLSSATVSVPDLAVISLLSLLTPIVLPRQFYMGLVEAREPGDLLRARFGLSAYLGAVMLLLPPIALAGIALLGDAVPPDFYMLRLPVALGYTGIAGMALIGGISAAASTAIVDTVALATMVSNDLLLPTVLGTVLGRGIDEDGSAGRRMLLTRRLSIAVIVAVALAWARFLPPSQPLAFLGLSAFAAMAQFTPHLLLAVRSGGRDASAARVSIAVGLALWFYTLALPQVLPGAWLAWLEAGPLDPRRLFGIGHASPIVHGVVWSLGANGLAYALATLRRGSPAPLLPRLVWRQRPVSDLIDLRQLTAAFVGSEKATGEFPEARRGVAIQPRDAARARQLIARVVGAYSARRLVASALAGGQMNLADVARLLDEGGHSLRFSRALLAATLENVGTAISVVDTEMNLIAWNSRYLELFGYPPGLVRVGTPVAELIRYNARTGVIGPLEAIDSGETIEAEVAKRLQHMRRGELHSFERVRHNGRAIKITGGPMPGGGYVTSFTDITEEVRVRAELQRTLQGLEQRVAERTRALSAVNRQLALADRDKTRFLAAASHDLLQPLHAARLFTRALQRQCGANEAALVTQVDSAIRAAEDLLRALLDISKLDAGGIRPNPENLALAPFLAGLADSFRPMAEEKGLRLLTGPLFGQLHTDPGLLRSVLQNFLANALRYTEHGGVLLGVRRRDGEIRIDVVDTGVGIAAEDIDAIFGEFTRLGQVEAEGLGLGLALAERIARLLEGRIEVISQPGKGSRFSLILSESAAPAPGTAAAADPSSPAPATAPASLAVLVVDDDPRIIEATTALLASLGHRALPAANMAQAMALWRQVDAALVDYRLAGGEDGLTLIEALRERRAELPALLITAESDEAMRQRAARLRVEVLAKPADPARIEDFLRKGKGPPAGRV